MQLVLDLSQVSIYLYLYLYKGTRTCAHTPQNNQMRIYKEILSCALSVTLNTGFYYILEAYKENFKKEK